MAVCMCVSLRRTINSKFHYRIDYERSDEIKDTKRIEADCANQVADKVYSCKLDIVKKGYGGFRSTL